MSLIEMVQQSEYYAVANSPSDRSLIAVAGEESDDDEEFQSADEHEEAGSPKGRSKPKLEREESTTLYLRTDVELQFELKKVGQEKSHTKIWCLKGLRAMTKLYRGHTFT